MSGRVYLVSKRLDPFLGVFTGIWAYALYERRLQRPEGHTLLELIRGKWNQHQQARQAINSAKAGEHEEGWEELTKELESAGAGAAAERR
ncbi:hypothetical protein BCR35DRAFT_298346 [Leucosporidium creatinivorum]|uniref:Uncharacterized protein n=1 Tax=Leucosporidium creatinivorum TaxID=106004 RepID=A0A1Y2G4D8_9BASI|nr:hypothetical protein BCR35DRAFT_298346 [Leucosporidium creatinivorum]